VVFRAAPHLDGDAHGLVTHVQDVNVARVGVTTHISGVKNFPSGGVGVGRGDARREDRFCGKHRVRGCLREGRGAGRAPGVPGRVAGELLVGLEAQVVVAEGEAGVADVELGDAVWLKRVFFSFFISEGRKKAFEDDKIDL
jgi:hypothetical protein